MMTGISRTKFDRATGEKISNEVIEHKEMDEKEYYGPMAEVLGKDFLDKWKKGLL